MMRVALAVVIVLALAGCAAPTPVTLTRTVVVREKVPAALLSCAGAPRVPDATLQSQVADYVIRLHAAWLDCSETVAAIGNFTNGKP